MRDYLYVAIALLAAAMILFVRLKYIIKGVKVMAKVCDYTCHNGCYFPIMEFDYDGQFMNIKTKSGLKRQKYDIGSEVEIYYIPGSEDEVKIVKDYSDILYILVFLICGIFMYYCLKNMNHHKL